MYLQNRSHLHCELSLLHLGLTDKSDTLCYKVCLLLSCSCEALVMLAGDRE